MRENTSRRLREISAEAQAFAMVAMTQAIDAQELEVKKRVIEYLLVTLEQTLDELDAVRHDFRTQARLALKMMEEERAAQRKEQVV